MKKKTFKNPRKKPKKKATIKAKAKKAGRKVKKVAKTDMGRAGIGGGTGLIALGPLANPALTPKAKNNPSGSNLKSLIANVAYGLESKSKPGVSARRGFINQARRYAHQDGFDGEAAFRSFQVYTLVGSKYSTLGSVRKTDYAKKKDIEKTIVKVASLISQNADRSSLTKAAVAASRQAADAAWTSARDAPRRSSRDAAWAAYAAADAADAAADVSGTDAAHDAARNARESAWAADDGAWADSNTSQDTAHTSAHDAMYADRANGLLNIMRKEAAKKNPEPTLVTKGKIGIAKFKGQGKGLTKKDLAQLEEIKGNLEIHYELASLYTGAKAKNERARIKDSLRDVNELIRGARRKANPKPPAKKKVVKKKATRKAKPEWQKLIDRCRKLWDHYCERPSKKRLKPVLEHLEKMKTSTSKKVADERKRCLRVANKEARRLKMK